MCQRLSVFFFFSSRRRHTRYWRDWSSDVCSSDLSDPIPCPPLNGLPSIIIPAPIPVPNVNKSPLLYPFNAPCAYSAIPATVASLSINTGILKYSSKGFFKGTILHFKLIHLITIPSLLATPGIPIPIALKSLFFTPPFFIRLLIKFLISFIIDLEPSSILVLQ